jgi:hypothetical protein
VAAPIDNPDIHLQRLLQPEKPWYQSFVQNIKDAINPPKLPPLEVTSKPVPVEEMWGAYAGNETKAGLSSLAIHVGVIALLLFLGSLKPVQKAMSKVVDLVAPDLSIYKPAPNKPQGGGGGGARAPLEASKGKLPKIAPKQFTPPRVDPLPDPKLPMVPTIVADTPIPNINALNYGDPMSRLGIPSNGSGMGGGIGSGSGGGVGPGRGPGFGPGFGWWIRRRRLQDRRRCFAAAPGFEGRAGVFGRSPQGQVAGHGSALAGGRRQGPAAADQGREVAGTGPRSEGDRSRREVALRAGQERRQSRRRLRDLSK